MADFSYDRLWRSESDNNVSAKDKTQDINLNRRKLKVNDTYEKGEKLTAYIEAINDEDAVNKAYLETKLPKIEGQISYIEKDYNEFILHNNKHSVEEILIESAV